MLFVINLCDATQLFDLNCPEEIFKEIMAHLNVLQTWFDHQSPQVQQNWQMHTKEINLIESS